MADDQAGGAGSAGDNGSMAGFTPPTEWADSPDYKQFFIEKDGKKDFDVAALAKTYAEIKAQIPQVPAKAEDYKAEFPKDFPADEVDVKLQKDLAKKLGLTQAQYEGIVAHDLARFSRVADEMAKSIETAKTELIKEWGGQQKFESNLAMARKAAQTFFGPDAFKGEPELGNNPAIIKGLYMIATKLSEDTLKGGTGAGADHRPVGDYGTPIFPSYLKTTPGPQDR